MVRGVPQGHANTISRPSASFRINRTIEFQKSLTTEAPNRYFISGKVRRPYIHRQFQFPEWAKTTLHF